ncbi:MAG: NAD(P)/FAD-dependent oxidoreductase [Mesorhizobium sp.]|nr:NAD(P)/FAD-dependent oxidoreductase [Mesorhizobium sp.]MBL8575941.1 NAD(P)/FAD-dependent oxidoreductase [Mesorhizobium sp.]
MQPHEARKRIAVVGAGISGLSAAWLLGKRHDVVLYERDGRPGGHANTVMAPSENGPVPIDTGFIVYNEATYPNLVALFDHLGVATKTSDMSFAVSRDGGRLEYSGAGLGGLFAQKRNMANPRFWSMLRDLVRFYRSAAADLAQLPASHTLGDYLDRGRYGAAFRDDHLLPMAGAIWSAPCSTMLGYPASAFIRFFHNHGLLLLGDRPQWRTVEGGSIAYVRKLTDTFSGSIRLAADIASIVRHDGHVSVFDRTGRERFDAVVIATHADQALRLLTDASPEERSLLGAFGYSRNEAVLHTDDSAMPRRRSVWSSWNHVDGKAGDEAASVTYWMNRLQRIETPRPLFVTLNPRTPLDEALVLRRETYQHPIFDQAAMEAQQRLWMLQGRRGTWFCGAHFGSGFHEDGLQSGLAVAEALGGVKRPWNVAEQSSRITLPEGWPTVPALEAEREIAA